MMYRTRFQFTPDSFLSRNRVGGASLPLSTQFGQGLKSFFLLSTFLLLMEQDGGAMWEGEEENNPSSVRWTLQENLENRINKPGLNHSSQEDGSKEKRIDLSAISYPLGSEQSLALDVPSGSSTILLSNVAYIEGLSDTTLNYMFSFLNINDLGRVGQVSSRWKRVTGDPSLWKYMSSKHYGDYLNQKKLQENPRQKVIQHYLCVLVNTKIDFTEIDKIVQQYALSLYVPLDLHDFFLKKYIDLHISPDKQNLWEEPKRYGRYDHRGLNNSLLNDNLEQGDPKAIERKIKGLAEGKYGYEKDPQAAREFNDGLIEKGDPEAIWRKIEGLSWAGYTDVHGRRTYKGRFSRPPMSNPNVWLEIYVGYGYLKSSAALKFFIEELTVSHHCATCAVGHYLKVLGQKYGILGYKKNWVEAIKYIKKYNVPY